MNFIPGQEPADASEQADQGQDLTDALSPGETEFVTGEPKKNKNAGTLGIVGLLALCGAGMYFMYMRNGPQAASAADAQTAEEIGTFLVDGEQHVKLMKQMLQNTEKVVQQFQQSSTRNQVPLAGLATNPFRMEVAKAPETAAVETESAARRRRDEERAAVVDAVKSVKLQLILYGKQKAALINDRMVYEGQEIEGLTVEKITPDSVIFRNGVYRAEKVFQK